MKKLVFFGLMVVFLTSSSTTIAVKSNPAKPKAKSEVPNPTKAGPDCLLQFDRKCNGGAPLVVLPGEIVASEDCDRFCVSNPITCSLTECGARLKVLFAFLPGSPKADSCLPAGFRGK